jgi:hypothetical protein
MKFAAATHTTSVTITGIPDEAGGYHGKEYIEKKLAGRNATVENRTGQSGKTLNGLVITFTEILTTKDLIPWPNGGPKLRELIEKLVGEAAVHVRKMEEAGQAKDKAYIDAFKFRGLSKQDPEGLLELHRKGKPDARDLEYFKAILETVAGQEEWAEQARTMNDPDDSPSDRLSLHAGALIDLKAGYDVVDAFLKEGWKKAGEKAQNQDTAVRELFIPFFELLDEDGRDDF